MTTNFNGFADCENVKLYVLTSDLPMSIFSTWICNVVKMYSRPRCELVHDYYS